MLPALVSLDDFALRIPGGIDEVDYDRAELTLTDASALVRAEAGKTWVNDSNELEDAPDVVVMVTIAAARRAFVNPDMLTSETVADYSKTVSSASPDIYLTRKEAQVIRRAAGRAGLWTQATTRVDVGPDVPSVTRGACASSSPEELDPYGEGWTG